MKKNNIIYITALSALLAGATPTAAYADEGDIHFTKDTGKGYIKAFGSKKAETYDVAVLAKGSTLKGMTIKSITIPFKSTTDISNLKVWLSNKLTLGTVGGKKTNVADILTQEANIDKDTITVTLATPYTIDADSIYIGYTFDAKVTTDDGKQPILITSEESSDAFFIHSSRTYRSWMDYSGQGSIVLDAVLGNASSDAATGSSIGQLVNGKGQPTETSIDIVNYGYNGVKSIDYSYEVAGTKGSSHIDFDEPIPAIYGAKEQVGITLPAIAEKGSYPIKVNIDKVNGTANLVSGDLTGNIDIYKVLPKHRAVLEEYTGTWCGYCPRGLVGLEVMNRLYPDDFIGLSYHNGDAMEIMSNKDFPSDISGFPAGWLDRSYEADAYYGWESNGFGIDKAWKSVSSAIVPVEASITEAKLSEDGAKVEATAHFAFIKDLPNANYKVEFVLVSDSLTGTSSAWNQSNYYSGKSQGGAETFPEPEFQEFYDGASTVKGLYFPDVVVATSRLKGEDVLLPTNIKEDDEIDATYEFVLDSVLNTNSVALIQKKTCLRVAALLIDDKGAIVNAAQAKVKVEGGLSGISEVTTRREQIAEDAAYDLMGRRTVAGEKGLLIIKEADGRTHKVLRK